MPGRLLEVGDPAVYRISFRIKTGFAGDRVAPCLVAWGCRFMGRRILPYSQPSTDRTPGSERPRWSSP